MKDIFILEGCVESIIYKNNLNSYTVFSLLPSAGPIIEVQEIPGRDKPEDKAPPAQGPLETDLEETVCVGNITGLTEGENVKITGFFVVHQIYGRQFQVKYYERLAPTTEASMERYLGSGIIKGVGIKLARKIVSKFGDETFSVIEENPALLTEIRGISEKKAFEIANAYSKHIQLKNTMLFLQDLGVSNVYAHKIYNIYKENTIDVIKTNPYKLADDIFGIGFKTADLIADRLGVEKNSIYRIKCGIKYALNSWALNGHTFAPKKRLLEDAAALLDVEGELIGKALTELQLESQIVQKNLDGADAVYLSYYHHAENYCANKIARLESKKENEIDIAGKIKQFEEMAGVSLAGGQAAAVNEAIKRDVLVITGGPGTGKTTTINALIYIMKQEGKEVLLAAPTGRAAKRMTEATGHFAQTIHRLLEINFLNEDSARQKFMKNDENPLECDAVIIDEASMLDILLFHSLLKAIPIGTKLILVGDADQLPSVGAGSVLSDIIKSGCVKVVLLEEIFRQAQLSAIVMNAHRINKGMPLVLNEKDGDFFFVKRESIPGAVSALLELVTERLPKYAGIKNPTEIQVLTPMRKSPLGVAELNKALQDKLNPKSSSKKEREFRHNVFREGDKVMQIKNNYTVSWVIKNSRGFIIDEGTGIFNGDQGFISEIDQETQTLTVAFEDGKIVDYDYAGLDELELAYAITIHKSQGSEYPVIVMPILTGPYPLMTRNLLYTAVTRARKLVVIVGSMERINAMIENNNEVARNTGLKESIIKAFSIIAG